MQHWPGLAASLLALAAGDDARRPLDLCERGDTGGDGTRTAFARSVALREAGGLPVSEIIADLTAQGFRRSDV